MATRKQNIREQNTPVYIVGEGLTEQYYFTHLKKLLGLYCFIKPRFFGHSSIQDIKKRVEELLLGDVCVIVVFDADVAAQDAKTKKEFDRFCKKYKNNKNVILCDSLPSIEYWFLLHFENTNRYFKDAKAVENVLKKYVCDYEKTTSFLEKEKWVKDLCGGGKLQIAKERAERFEETDGSYTNLYEAIDKLNNHVLEVHGCLVYSNRIISTNCIK